MLDAPAGEPPAPSPAAASAAEQRRRVLVEPDRVTGWFPGRTWTVGERVRVDARDGALARGKGGFGAAAAAGAPLARRRGCDEWAAWGSHRCRELAAADHYLGPDWFFGPLPAPPPPPPRVAGAAGVVLPPADDAAAWEGTLKKWQGCGSFHRPRWYTGPRLADAPWRTREEDCHVLFLPRAAAHGLDLSFVTHIFLLEAILDPELFEQIVARAHRLGAGGAVVVETVHLFLPGDDDGGADGAGGAIAAADGAASGGAVAGRKPPQNFVCTYCYKSFKQRAACEEHERERCLRNPDRSATLAEGRFTLFSMFSEIKPPPAV